MSNSKDWTDLNEIKKLVKKQILKKLNENIKLITEKWSISEEVEQYSEIILDDILSDINNAETEVIDKGLIFYTNKIDKYTILSQTFSINYYIYNCNNFEMCHFIYESGEKINGYQEDEKILNLTLYMVNNRWQMEYCGKNVSHEVEHIIQIHYGFTKNPNYTKLMDNAYEHANYVLRQETGYSKIDKLLAWIVYYSNSHEQDAFMQEYANDLKTNPRLMYTKKAEAHRIIDRYSEYCNYLLANKDKPNIEKSINQYKIFGYNKTNFELMCTKQLGRFKRKMNNIEKNFTNGNKKLWMSTDTV